MRSILEKALIALLNEDKDQAEALFHDFILERSRQIHESLRQGEDIILDESWEQELSIDEMFTEADLDENDTTGQGGMIRNDGWFSISKEHMLSAEDMAQYDAKFNDLGYYDDVDYEWSIAGGDDAPDGIIIASQDMRDDPQILALLSEIHGEGAYDSLGEAEGDDDKSNDTAEADADAEDKEEEEVADEPESIEDRVESLEDELTRLSAEFDAMMGSDEADLDDMSADVDLEGGEEGDTAVVQNGEDDLDLGNEEEAFESLGESAFDNFEEVKVDHAEGKTTSKEKYSVNTKAAGIQPKLDDRAFKGEPVQIKAKEHNGYEREAAPKTAQIAKRQNIKSKAEDGQSSVSKEGDKSALLNTGKEDKSAPKGLFSKKMVK